MKNSSLIQLFALGLSSFALTSCLGGSGFETAATSASSSTSAPPCNVGYCTTTAQSDLTAYEGQNFVFNFSTSNAGPTYYLSKKPSWATIDGARSQITGVPTAPATITDAQLSVYDGTNTEVFGPFDLTVIGDPLTQYAWHLKNLGQKGFSTGAGVAGQDINLAPVIADGGLGTGVRVAVSDTGVEIAHEDLAANLSAGESRNYTLPAPYIGNPTPSVGTGSMGHGTSVTGLIAAVGWNSKGARGVAPGAHFAGMNFLDPAVTYTDLIFLDQADNDFDIYNYSYGYSQCLYDTYLPSYAAQVRTGVTTFRSNKGSLYVKSAGNDYIGDVNDCDSGTPAGTTPYFGNANSDPYNTLIEHIIVGAVNARGVRSSYSSPGSNLWVSAPGGEFGDDSPAMISVDMTGCTNGFSKTGDTSNSFEDGDATLNSNCNYTSTMNGTSSAAPVTSGVIALMLEANPALTWREVKHILATTATVINSSAGSTKHPFNRDLTGHTYQQGWVKNAAGIKFHNWYGFGRINAGAAVKAAADFAVPLPTLKETENPEGVWDYTSTNTVPLAIPDGSASGVTNTIVSVHNYIIEGVKVKVNVTHDFPTDLGIELTSPMGTKSILKNINDGIVDQNLVNAIFLTNAFYGESSSGNWKLKVIDGLAQEVGTLDNWSLEIIGHISATPAEVVIPLAPTIATPANGTTVASLTATPTVTWTASASADKARYEFSIGTTMGGTEVAAWQFAGGLTTLSKMKSGLTLVDGTTYYFNVRTVDVNENVSLSTSVSWVADVP